MGALSAPGMSGAKSMTEPLEMLGKKDVVEIINRVLRRWHGEVNDLDEMWRPLEHLGRQPRGTLRAPPADFSPGLRVYADPGMSLQEPFDFAVVMPSTLRPSIAEALLSIFAQDFAGRVQTWIGIDCPQSSLALLDEICAQRPAHHAVFCLYPGFSTSARHGGLHPAWDGGATRTVLSYLANSRRLAYLDDDNWWSPRHLASMAAALEQAEWAYARRWFVHPSSRRPICPDQWESVGPDQGSFLGGWVDPNCLALDKIACEAVLRWWSIPLRNSGKAMDADRNVFRLLRTYFRGQSTNEATVFYVLDENDQQHPHRVKHIGQDRYAHCAS